MALYQSGDEAAFREIYMEYIASLRYFAYRYLADADAIEDVIQDAFVAAWEKRAAISSEPALKAYLYSAVRHACLKIIRHEDVKARYADRHSGEEETVSFLDDVIASETFSMLRDVFRELSPATRQVYEMSLSGMKHEEIAEKLGITIHTVKKHKNNANHYMRARLKNFLSLMAYLQGM